MPADLDLSPEAVERLAARCEQYARSITGEVNPRHAQALTAATLRALAAANERLLAFLHDFASHRFERFDPLSGDWRDPAAMPEPSTPYLPVEAWQDDARTALAKGDPQ